MKKLLLSLLLGLSLSASAAIISPLPVTLQNGTTADANQVMSNFNAIVNNVNSNAAALATSAQINLTNTFSLPQIVPNATALTHAVNAGQIQQNGLTYFVDTGAVNAYVVTAAPAWASYAAGGHVYVKIVNANTAASTLNVNGLGAKAILNEDLSVTEANALLAGGVYHLIYDGTQFVIIGKNNTAPTQGANDNSTKVATTAFVYLQVPAGAVMDFAGTTTPTGWLPCDGASLLRAGTFAALFTAIGTTWGSVDGTHFNAPDFRGRATIDDGTGGGLTARTVGQTGGEETHLLTTPEMPSHTHTVQSFNGFPQGGDGGATSRPSRRLFNAGSEVAFATDSPVLNNTGGGGAHNTMMPFAVVRKIIKY